MRLPSLLSVAAALDFCGCTSVYNSAPSDAAGMVNGADLVIDGGYTIK